MLGAKEKPVGVIQVESNWFHATRGTRAGQEEDQASFFPDLGALVTPWSESIHVHPLFPYPNPEATRPRPPMRLEHILYDDAYDIFTAPLTPCQPPPVIR